MRLLQSILCFESKMSEMYEFKFCRHYTLYIYVRILEYTNLKIRLQIVNLPLYSIKPRTQLNAQTGYCCWLPVITYLRLLASSFVTFSIQLLGTRRSFLEHSTFSKYIVKYLSDFSTSDKVRKKFE